MLRLVVYDVASSLVKELQPRLRGIRLSAGEATGIDQHDAVVCNCSMLNSAELESQLQGGRRLFFIVDLLPDAMLSAPFASDSRIKLVNPERFHPKNQIIRQQLDAGKLGEPGFLRLHRWEPTPLRLCDLDLVLWYFAKAPNLVFATANDTCTQIHLGFPGGGMAMLDYATGLPRGETYYSVSLICAHGAAYADEHADMQLAYQSGAPRAIRAEQTIVQWATMLQSFVEPSETKSTHIWKDVVAANDAIEQSLRTHQSVALEGA
jgi:hypothetical protein